MRGGLKLGSGRWEQVAMKIKEFLRKHIFPFIPTLKIPEVSRISLDFELGRQFKRLKPGIVLDAGSKDGVYKNYVPHTKFMRLDIDEKSEPDICCDLHEIEWQSRYFDTVIATEVLEHLYDPQKAIDEIYRILKPGGICILSTRFIYPYHPAPHDYYRFTRESLDYLFKRFSRVEIHHHGNKLQVLWQIITIGRFSLVFNPILNLFNPVLARIHSKETNFPCGFVVYARR